MRDAAGKCAPAMVGGASRWGLRPLFRRGDLRTNAAGDASASESLRELHPSEVIATGGRCGVPIVESVPEGKSQDKRQSHSGEEPT